MKCTIKANRYELHSLDHSLTDTFILQKFDSLYDFYAQFMFVIQDNPSNPHHIPLRFVTLYTVLM